MSANADLNTTNFTRRVGFFTLGTLISRLLGVVRESVFAYLFGASDTTDAFNVAFRIPNLLRDLFAESALSAAFVPAFVHSLRQGDKKKTWYFATNVLNTILLVISVLVITGIIFAPYIVQLIAWGYRPNYEKLSLTIALTRIMFPFLLFVALAAWAMGILNACGSFFTPAVAPAAFNTLSALFPLVTYSLFTKLGYPEILAMGYGVTLGAIFQFLIQLPRLHTFGFRYTPAINLRDPQLHQLLRRWLPMVLGLAAWQINFLINTFLLTFLPTGSITWVSYAYRIQHLPAGLFGVAIGTVALAQFSRTATDRVVDPEQFNHGLNLVILLTIPAAVLLFVLAQPIVRLLYEHGRFTSLDTRLTAQALALYSLGIFPAAATRNCASGFYATGNTRTPTKVAVIVVTTNILLNLLLMRIIGFRSFPLTASLTQFLNFSLLYILLLKNQPALFSSGTVSLFIRTTFAAITAGIATALVLRISEQIFPIAGLLFRIIEPLAAGTFGIWVYYLVARILKIKELDWVLLAFVRRLSSK